MLFSLKSISLFSIAMALDTLGNILFKKGMNHYIVMTLPGWRGHWQLVKYAIKSKIIILGVAAMLLEAIFWLAFLSMTPLNIAAPLSSANNIFIFIASAWFLKERVKSSRWVGVGLIVTGMLLVSGSTA